ncbi:hypothetical protein N9V56_00815 [Alphaproteobacteria bacterium]|nr:hypothetical protein [Alphaproteobacteria bacterium]
MPSSIDKREFEEYRQSVNSINNNNNEELENLINDYKRISANDTSTRLKYLIEMNKIIASEIFYLEQTSTS